MESRHPVPEDRTVRNLHIVARHLAAGAPARPASRPREESRRKAPAGGRSRSRALAKWGPVGVVAAFLLGKAEFLLAALKFANLGTFLSMLITVWAYAQFWGFAFALGFVLLIFVHEGGHALVMRRQGIAAGAPVFIPFVGAVIAMKERPRDAYVESVVALGGPALGTAGAIVCLAIGAVTGSHLWYALASTGFLINLFNMIPVSPLDGGRIVGVISRWIWAAGYAIGIAVLVATRSPILFLILLLGLLGLGRALRGPRPGYYDVPVSARRFVGLTYFGLLAVMALGMWTAQRPLEGFGLGR